MTRRLLLLVAVVGVLVWSTGAPAAAHASLLSTDPAAGSVVATAPARVVLTFNEPVRLPDSAVHAFKADGSDWKVTAQVTDNRLVVTPTEDPGSGTVVVAWKVISADSHVVGGALTFSIGAATAGGPASGGSAAPPASVRLLGWLAGGAAGLGLVVAALLTLLRRRADLVWNLGFAAAVLLAPLQQLAEEVRGLSGLSDWLVWVDGVTRPSSLLLLAAYAVTAAARSVRPRVVAAVLTAPALVLAGGAAYSWPAGHDKGPPGASVVSSEPLSAPLGSSGSVELTVSRGAGRTVSVALRLLDTSGGPLSPYAPPTLTVSDKEVDLGDAPVTPTGPGVYRAELTVPTDGTWTAQVSVRVDEFTNPVAEVAFPVG